MTTKKPMTTAQKKRRVSEKNKLLPFCPPGTRLAYYCPHCGDVNLVQDGKYHRCLSCEFRFEVKP